MSEKTQCDKIYYLGFDLDLWKNFKLFFYCYIKKYKICNFQPGLASRINAKLLSLPIFKKFVSNNICIVDQSIGDLPGKYYEASKKARELTEQYWQQASSFEKKMVEILDKEFSTNKCIYFFKQRISEEIFALLKIIYQFNSFSDEKSCLLIPDTTVARFIFSNKGIFDGKEYQLVNISSGINKVFLFYAGFFKNLFFTKGFTYRQKKQNFKLAKESIWRFSRPTLKDDLLIDEIHFKKDELLLLLTHPDIGRRAAFKIAQAKGYATEVLRTMPVNLAYAGWKFFRRYFLCTLYAFFVSLRSFNPELIFSCAVFFQRAFYFETLMLNFNINFFISNTDSGDIVTTVVFNEYGTRTVFCHWSDLAVVPDYAMAYAGHNICFCWGKFFYEMQYQNSGINEVIYVGCIYKNAIDYVIKHKVDYLKCLDIRSNQKIVTFCDNSFSNQSPFSEDCYVRFIEVLRNFVRSNREVKVFLKPKNSKLDSQNISLKNHKKFTEMIYELKCFDNFAEIHPEDGVMETYIGISDVLINFSINSPAMLSLLCQKNALYFDQTANQYHPFAIKYPDQLVFSEEKKLFMKVEQILKNDVQVWDIVSEEEKECFDAYRDNGAIDRIRTFLFENMKWKKV